MGRLKHQDRKEGQVRVLCLPYGKEADWLALPEARREELLHQDEVLPQRGALIAVVGEPTVVRAQDARWFDPPASMRLRTRPLCGFSITAPAGLEAAAHRSAARDGGNAR
jgi:hypothetical protein